jgi:hypothetical protein
MALKMLVKKRPKKSVVPPSGGIRKTVNVPAKKHGAPSAHIEINWFPKQCPIINCILELITYIMYFINF